MRAIIHCNRAINDVIKHISGTVIFHLLLQLSHTLLVRLLSFDHWVSGARHYPTEMCLNQIAEVYQDVPYLHIHSRSNILSSLQSDNIKIKKKEMQAIFFYPSAKLYSVLAGAIWRLPEFQLCSVTYFLFT